MASLKSIFGIYPETSVYENQREQLQQEFSRLHEIEQSKEYEKYNSLKEIVHSSDFKNKKKQIEKQTFKKTPEYLEEKKFIRLSKQKNIKLYYQTISSALFRNFQEVSGSKELEEHNELSNFIKSAEFLKVKKYMALPPKKKFLSSELYKTVQQFEAQKKSNRIRAYLKFTNHKLYNNYKEIKNSGLLTEFHDLQKFIRSGEIEKAKSTMSKSDFLLSKEYQKLQEFNELKKNNQLKDFFKLDKLPQRKIYDELEGSKELKEFLELEKYINSDSYSSKKSEVENQRFEDTDEYAILGRYNDLKSSKPISDYFKFINSKEYQNYKQLDGSETIKNYEKLKKVIESEDFLKVKEYMALSPKQKWELSDEFKQLEEYQSLHSSDNIQFYLKNRGRKEFDWFNEWDLTFEDKFEDGKLDRKKWMTRYFWGDELIDESYSLESEKHLFTDGNNLEFGKHTVKIITKKEEKDGKMWNPLVGFVPKTFEYTSGLISTGKSFRQKYGLFEAKIKINGNKNIVNAFWMISDSRLPHLDVMNASRKVNLRKLSGDSQNQVKKFVKTIKREKLCSDYIIYAVEWMPHKISWKINGMEVASTNTDIPQEPMYMILSSGLYEDVNGSVLPSEMVIDYVRVYQKSEY